MPVIALVGNKGGAGKTTLCVNLATAFAQQHSTVVVDADPQRSSLQWRDIADNDDALPVVEGESDLVAQCQQLADDFQYCFIDCPPSVHSIQMQQALTAANLALAPVQPSPLDIWATVHIEKEVIETRNHNPELQALLVINQLEPRTRLSKIMHQALAELGMPAAQTAIRRRVAYRNSFLEGRTVHEQGRRGEDAAEEIHQLANEILEYL